MKDVEYGTVRQEEMRKTPEKICGCSERGMALQRMVKLRQKKKLTLHFHSSKASACVAFMK